MTAPARTAAFHALRAIAGHRADLPDALAQTREHLSDDRDRALAAEIVTGTLRWQRTLEYLVEQISHRPLGKLDPEVATILLLSLYQILHLDRVPASAVVDDAVDLTRAARKPSATGFVNGVLRTTLRQRHRLPLPPRPGHTEGRQAALDYLGVTESHPAWLVARWLDRHGFDATERWLQFNNRIPPLTLRANTLGRSRDDVSQALRERGIATAPTAYAPHGLVVTSGHPLRQPSGGLFFVQDEASQLVPLVVAAQPGERVLDLCASPGGKATAMLADMRDTGTLVASDVRPRRIALLRETVRASGAVHIHVVRVGESGALPFRCGFDRVLVDAPCSGLGTIRRDPDIRWRRTENDLPVLARAQVALLARAATVLHPGGRLVYSTCSSEPEENEEVIETFLASHSAFTLIDLRSRGHAAIRPLLDDRGMMRTLPFVHSLESFFAAALMRA